MRALVDAVLSVLLAPSCAACHEPLAHPTRGCVCEACWAQVSPLPAPLCQRCGEPLPRTSSLLVCQTCLRARPLVTQARAAGPYSGTLRTIVHALKYDGRRSLARPLAARMRVAGADLCRGCELVVPVPLHSARRRSRGFNQAHDLACHLGLPVVQALQRTRDTHTQTTLPAEARHANVAHAFAVARRMDALRGTTVLLVDDVRTTGATLEACAEALLGAGVREVRALTAARVETPGG